MRVLAHAQAIRVSEAAEVEAVKARIAEDLLRPRDDDDD